MHTTGHYSKIIAGTMTWGSWGKKLSKNEMTNLMHHCIENGMTTFDHADIYGDYSTELDFGSAYAGSGIQRSEIQLITKCGIQMASGRNNRLKHYEHSREYIVWSAEASLKKLKTEYLDLFLLHRPSPLMEPYGIAGAVDHLLGSGKIKRFGVSNFTPSQIAMLEKAIPVSVNQIEFSLTHTAPMYNGTFDDCMANGRIAMAWSPLGNVYRKKDKRTERIKKTMALLAEKHGVDESQLLLAWMLKHPVGVYPVIGTTNKHRIALAVKAAEIDLEPQDWFALLASSQGHGVP